MAPFIGPSRAKVLSKLCCPFGSLLFLPITLGQMAPRALIQREPDGRITLRPLVIDRNRSATAGREALARGGIWVPEMEWQFMEPGAPILVARTALGLAARISGMPWVW